MVTGVAGFRDRHIVGIKIGHTGGCVSPPMWERRVHRRRRSRARGELDFYHSTIARILDQEDETKAPESEKRQGKEEAELQVRPEERDTPPLPAPP